MNAKNFDGRMISSVGSGISYKKLELRMQMFIILLRELRYVKRRKVSTKHNFAQGTFVIADCKKA